MNKPEENDVKDLKQSTKTTNSQQETNRKPVVHMPTLDSFDFFPDTNTEQLKNVTQSENEAVVKEEETIEKPSEITENVTTDKPVLVENSVKNNVIEESDTKTNVPAVTVDVVEESRVEEAEITSGDIAEAETATTQIMPAEMETEILIEGANFVEHEEIEENYINNSDDGYTVVLNDISVDTFTIGHEEKEQSDDAEIFTEAQQEMVQLNSSEDNVAVDETARPAEHATAELALADVEMVEEAVVNEEEENPQQVVVLQDVIVGAEEIEQPSEVLVDEIETLEKENQNNESVEAENQVVEEQPTPSNIPCHVLGRSVDKPLVDPVRNGKVLLKPRLGVKIPYRNLTSQIVSKQEIAEEIMERSRLRQSAAEPPAGGDVFFAKKLTQRLAKKLVPPSSGKGSQRTTRTRKPGDGALGSSKSAEKPTATVTVMVTASEDTIASQKPSTEVEKDPLDISGKIIDNSDLIALLEGDDGPDFNIGLKTNVVMPLQKPERQSPNWERETALRQLRDLPKHTKGTPKIIKPLENTKSIVSAEKPPPDPPTEKSSKKNDALDDINIEPRFHSNTVVKTYTRKRKPFEDFKFTTKKYEKIKTEEEPPVNTQNSPSVTRSGSLKNAAAHKVSSPPKSSSAVQSTMEKSSASEKSSSVSNKTDEREAETPRATTPIAQKPTTESKKLSPNTYISKSSRIVKRKKIWDPDEVMPALKVKSYKSTDTPEKSPSKSPEKRINASKVTPTTTQTPTAKVKVVQAAILKQNNDKSPSKKVIVKKGLNRRKFKRLTEVDRLLMDEGAVNLLYSVKNTEELQNFAKKKKKMLISLDKAQRDLLNKTNEIKNDLQINSTKDSPINLRKKEGVSPPKVAVIKELAASVILRKKSKDSASGSVHSPPASPGFAYTQHAEASRIIRRHSSSSFSSRNSESGDEDVEQHAAEKKHAKKEKKGKEKQGKLGGIDKQLLNEEMARNFNKVQPEDPKYSQFELFTVRRFDNFVQLILSSTSLNGQTALTVQVLRDLTEILGILQKDDSCRVVLLSSCGNSFCQGIDYKELASNDETKRQSLAETLAACVRDFLTALAKFSKLLVAGVHGNTIGLGVTMLPLFDMILASDTATFSTPYAHLGCAAEGGVLLTLPHVMHNALASELFFASRKLTAAEALRLGLVTRTLWPDKFQDELISALKIISGQSLQSMQAIKKQLRHHLLVNVEESLMSESAMLVQHWTGKECQNNFMSYSLETK